MSERARGRAGLGHCLRIDFSWCSSCLFAAVFVLWYLTFYNFAGWPQEASGKRVEGVGLSRLQQGGDISISKIKLLPP